LSARLQSRAELKSRLVLDRLLLLHLEEEEAQSVTTSKK
jgi:hypothetical protein